MTLGHIDLPHINPLGIYEIKIMSEKDFFETIAANGHVWVAMQEIEVVAFKVGEDNDTVGLPVWECEENAEGFLSNIGAAKLIRPVGVPLEVFKVKWLEKPSMNIDELIICPNGLDSKNLVLTKEEFITRLMC